MSAIKQVFIAISCLILAAIILAACAATTAPAANPTADTNPAVTFATETPSVGQLEIIPTSEIPGLNAPEDSVLVAEPVTNPPKLDGTANDEYWNVAQELIIPVFGGANRFSTNARLKAVYTSDALFFLLTYADSTN